MTDVTVVPDTSTPASTPTETPISDTRPAGTPTPIGSQAPDKSPEQIEYDRATSRREAIQKAFDKSREGETPKDEKRPQPQAKDKGAAKPVTATPQQTPKAEAEKQAPARGDGGRFTSTRPAAPVETSQAPKAQPLPENAPFRDAPKRFSDVAKNDWASVPESVRGATHQVLREMEGGIAKYKQGAEEFETIREFHDLATKYGTNLRTALTNYVSMENKLRGDLVGGLDMIVNNLNLRTSQGQRIGLRDVAAYILNMSPDQHRLTAAQNATQSQDMRMGQLHQTVESLAQTVKSMQYHQQFSQTRSAVDQFADTHPRFDELSDLIKEEIDHGYSIDQAYERADKLRPGTGPRQSPATHAAQTRNTSAQTRTEVDKSISGAPGRGDYDQRPRNSSTRREAVANAVKRVRGSL